MSEKKSFYSFEEAAWILNITSQEIEAFVANKELKSYKLSGSRQIKHGDLSKFQKQLQESKGEEEVFDECLSFNEVLKILQLEEQELERFINDGVLKVTLVEGQVKFFKSDVEVFRRGRMDEPTVMVEEGDVLEGDDILAEDEDDIF